MRETAQVVAHAPGRVVVVGDLAAHQRRIPSLWEGRSNLGHSPVVLATAGASTAETAATQLPQLKGIRPAGVVIQLGHVDVLDGFDESYFHARLVEICDRLRTVAPDADVMVVGMPRLPAGTSSNLIQVWSQCNAAAAATAELRGFGWSSFDG